MANPETQNRVSEPDIEEMFRTRYLEMVRLAGLLGADDPEDIAQEAFLRLMKASPRILDQQDVLPYLRAIVVNLTRNRHRHLRVVRQHSLASGLVEQAAIGAEDHREVIAALAELPARRREAIVLRYWLDLPEREIAAAMGVSPGTVKSHISRGLAGLSVTLKSLYALEEKA